MARLLRPVPDAPPRAILYLRQSTYREESISLELQETAGRDYCERQGYVVVAVEQDPGVSGRTWKRPAVQRVMASIEAGDAEVIVLWRWSRLSRSRKDWALAADRVDVAGGRIESATEPNDVTAAGRFARGVMTEMAAFESERIGEQWREVQENRVSRGLPSGRVPWGWVNQDGHAKPHPENGPVIPRLYQMYAEGAGSIMLASWLMKNGYRTFYGSTEWNRSTVTQILDSPFHAGMITYRGELHPGEHEPLVSVETWEQYKAMRAVRAGERTARHSYLLSGILRCHCGAPLFGFAIHKGKRSTSSYFGYRCRDVSTNREHGPGTISAKIVDAAFMEWLRGLGDITAPAIALAEEPDRAEGQRLSREILAIDKQVIALTRQLGEGIIPERAYKATVDDMESRRAGLADALALVERAAVLVPDDAPAIAADLLELWEVTPLTTRRAGIRSLVEAIRIDFGENRTMTIIPRGSSPVAMPI